MLLEIQKGSIEDQDKAIDLDPDEVDPYINRGIAEESLGLWLKAKKIILYVISKENDNFSALYNYGNVEGSLSHCKVQEIYFSKLQNQILVLLWQDQVMALSDYQLGNMEASEKQLKKLIRRYPTFADARAALTALNWSKGILAKLRVIGLQ